MFCTFLLLAFFPFASFSASVLQPSQGTANVGPGSLSALTLGDPSSLEPIESDSSLIIQSTGSSQSPNTTVLLINSSLTGSEYDLPFEYPGLDDVLGATNAGLQCKGESFGFNLSRLSCTQAYGRIATSTSVGTWGQRGQGSYNAILPFRWSSFDGFCAIDLVHNKNSVSDSASPLQIKQAAAQVMNGCIRNGAPNTGGMIGNVGQNGNLVVIIRLYIPKVTCRMVGSLARGSCNAVLDGIPVATERLVFGKAGDPATRVIVPRSFVAAGSRCKENVNPPLNGVGVTTRWFDIWEAAKSVDAICLARHQSGFAYSVGGLNGLMVELAEKTRPGSIS